jgi:8-oxo-dGTP pyrophosphatase MutT (NUDIX family)
MPNLILALQALSELGPRQLWLFAWYRALLNIGYYRRIRPPGKVEKPGNLRGPLKQIPSSQQLISTIDTDLPGLIGEADLITEGMVRLFGATLAPMHLSPPEPVCHWSEYESGRATISIPREATEQDIKFLWEPARFGWAFTLGRAYCVTGNELYAETFWRFADDFLMANPPYWGVNWTSGQEVALRILAFAFAGQVFSPATATTPERRTRLATAIGEHAARIPLTLSYARAQYNNHLLSEAAGLFTAATCLPEHAQAKQWSRLGWEWFERGILSQVDEDGVYIQHSTNYHRLMLHLGLWVDMISRRQGMELPVAVRERLAAAAKWLLALVEPGSGYAPNLGPNDGANILPLSACIFGDYRPVVQAACQAFCGFSPFEHGTWDELALWLGSLELKQNAAPVLDRVTPHIVRADDDRSWAYLRAAQFHSRPGHADQLHLDLWYRGINIAQDAGTYLYTASPPWDNSLTHSAVHNTITVNNQEQMRRAGRFLYLDWAQAEVIAGERARYGDWHRLSARHNGYRFLGIIHQRTVSSPRSGRWLVEDLLMSSRSKPDDQAYSVRLHWLLPDYSWEWEGDTLSLQSPRGPIRLRVSVSGSKQTDSFQVSLARGGELVYGTGPVEPTRGWVSPTYGVKLPALSIAVSITSRLPLEISSEWLLPERKPRKRAVALLVQGDRIAMIERVRAGQTYYVFPGGGVHKGETLEQAAVREAREELGLQVRVERLAAQSIYGKDLHLYYIVVQEGGQFGTGEGRELSRSAYSPRGSVRPVWLSLEDLRDRDVYPRYIAELVIQAARDGWPEQPVQFFEPGAE